jgi:hypothetical protein
MIYIIFFILCFILCSCQEDENKPYNINITGTVTDQVTNQPVLGATVFLGIQRGAMPGDSLMSPKQSTSTGSDGKYQLITSTESVKDLRSVPIGMRGYSIALIANKSGYIGSNRQEIYYYNAQNSVLDFLLYHSSELHLHIKNDTINSLDAVDIKLIKTRNYNPLTVITLVCNKRKLDSTYVIKNLWGNWKYVIQVLKPGGQAFSPPIEYTITPSPDAINNFDISF